MEILTDPQAWIALLTLTALEIVLGVDNIIFISILCGKLPEEQREKGRIIGLGLAMFTRILLLFSIKWVMTLVQPLFTVLTHKVSGRDIILFVGGLFLLGKSTHEIHDSLEGQHEDTSSQVMFSSFTSVIIQIAILDIVFSLDSVITAVGLVEQISVMVAAIVISVIIMMWSAKAIGDFVDSHPTIKILALSFLILVGVTLIAESFHAHISKGYIYFAMAFSVAVEMINLKVIERTMEPIRLRKTLTA
ncbi:TerC family protein [Candidatus Riflebacteria bacterium]